MISFQVRSDFSTNLYAKEMTEDIMTGRLESEMFQKRRENNLQRQVEGETI
jgi:hypothetical protein